MKIFRDVFYELYEYGKSILCKGEVLKLSFHNEVGSYYEVSYQVKDLINIFSYGVGMCCSPSTAFYFLCERLLCWG
jgi:hypothetical protein